MTPKETQTKSGTGPIVISEAFEKKSRSLGHST